MAYDVIREQIDPNGLVHPNLSRRRHPVADSHYVLTADRLAGLRLLRARRFCCGGEPRHICSAPFSVRRAARIWARLRGKGIRNQYARYHVAAYWRSGATGTDARGTGAGINHRSGGAIGAWRHRSWVVCSWRITSLAQSFDSRRRRSHRAVADVERRARSFYFVAGVPNGWWAG